MGRIYKLWCGHRLHPNHAYPACFKFRLGRTLLICFQICWLWKFICLMTSHEKRQDTAYHKYFILMFDTVHGDHQRGKTVGDTVKENRLIVRFWLLVWKSTIKYHKFMSYLSLILAAWFTMILHERGPSMSTRMCSVAMKNILQLKVFMLEKSLNLPER